MQSVVFTTYAYKIYLFKIFKIEEKKRVMLGVVCAVFLCFNQIVSSPGDLTLSTN